MPQYDSSTYPLITDPQPDDRVLIWQESSGSNVRVKVEDLVPISASTVMPVVNGGTGQSSFTDGQVLIGNTLNGSLNKTTITAGSNVAITNGHGTITISASTGGIALPSAGPLYGTLVKDISGLITTSTDTVWRSADVFNVKDYGAVGSDPATVVGAQGYLVAGTFIVGNHYVVKNTGSGSTDFTIIGSADNVPGTEFVATGAGTGTGQAYVDDSFAFQAAIDAAAANKLGAVYVPAGLWGVRNLEVPVANNPSIAIIGDGPDHSRLQNFLVGNNSDPILSWFPGGGTLKSNGFIRGISFRNYGNRAVNSPILLFEAAERVEMTDVSAFAMYDCVKFSSSNLRGSNVSIASGTTNNDYSGCCLKMENGGCNLVNSSVRSTSLLGTPTGVNLGLAPPIWITGTSTGNQFTNVGVTGAGCKYSIAPSSLVITAGSCVISGLTAHTFQVNDYIVTSGMTPSYFNGYFRVVSKTGTSVTVANANVDSSASAIGLAYTVPCSVLVDNASGAQNESSWVGGLIEAAGYPLAALSCGFYIDGRAQGTLTSGHAISGWNINGTYVDMGRVSVLITGGGNDGTCLTTNRINISGIMASGNAGDSTSSMLGEVWVEQSPGITISGMIGSPSLVDADAKGVYAFSDGNPAHITCNGLRILSSHVGTPAAYNFSPSPQTLCKYGLVLDGPIDGLVLNGNTVSGITAPVLVLNSAIAATSIVQSTGNLFTTGSSAPAAATVIPTVASAGTISLPFNDTLNISGTTNIATINGGWVGRVVKLLVASGLTFTGGNIKGTYAIAAGSAISLVFDGAYWWNS